MRYVGATVNDEARQKFKDTTLACSCNSGSVYCVYVTEKKYI